MQTQTLSPLRVSAPANAHGATHSEPISFEEPYLLIPLDELRDDAAPLKPLPPDMMTDVYYQTISQPRCHLCRSPHRSRAERVYLAAGRRPQAVVHFFGDYYGVAISWQAVSVHMDRHCELQNLNQSGLYAIEQRLDHALQWRYRERELAAVGLLQQVDTINGIDTSKKPELAIRTAAILLNLYKTLTTMSDERDAAALKSINIMDVLFDIFGRMVDDRDRAMLLEKVRELRQQLGAYSE
jgi:hypothetical protein